jgi:hypothetical protein
MASYLLALAWEVFSVAIVTLILSRSRLFKPLRLWLYRHGGLLGDLIGCTFCTSVWVSAGHAWLWRESLPLASATGFFISTFALTGLAAPVMWMCYRCFQHIPNNDVTDVEE